MHILHWIPWVAGGVAVYLLSRLGISSRGKAMRVQYETKGKDKDGKEICTCASESWYIKGKRRSKFKHSTQTPGAAAAVAGAATGGDGGAEYSCSFVEFDERGEFLNFDQHLDCQRKIDDLVKDGKRLVLVTYCHGWRNSSHSTDVVQFNMFLGTLAVQLQNEWDKVKVHGVYLSWRGNSYWPYIDTNSEEYLQTTEDFGAPIVDPRYYRTNLYPLTLVEIPTYWDRKTIAEHKASGIPISRAIFTYASAAKGYGAHQNNFVCVVGHSMGAMMMERSLCAAMTGALTLRWWGPHQMKAEIEKQNKNKASGDSAPADKPADALKDKPSDIITGAPLPFELVLLLNSAAPALYAKQMRDLLMAHHLWLQDAKRPEADMPVVVAVTSTADWATGIAHYAGNILSRFQPTLKRDYTRSILGDPEPGDERKFPDHPPIPQYKFYETTAGHNNYLINHWITKVKAESHKYSHEDVFYSNFYSKPPSWRLPRHQPRPQPSRSTLPLPPLPAKNRRLIPRSLGRPWICSLLPGERKGIPE